MFEVGKKYRGLASSNYVVEVEHVSRGWAFGFCQWSNNYVGPWSADANQFSQYQEIPPEPQRWSTWGAVAPHIMAPATNKEHSLQLVEEYDWTGVVRYDWEQVKNAPVKLVKVEIEQ